MATADRRLLMACASQCFKMLAMASSFMGTLLIGVARGRMKMITKEDNIHPINGYYLRGKGLLISSGGLNVHWSMNEGT